MKRTILILCLLILLFSCTTENTQNELDENFYALKVGNSWGYKNYKHNINTGIYEETGVVDSLSITSTEDILGVTYYKFRRFTTGNESGITFCNPNGEHFEYLREYNGNLVKSDGTIKFTNNDYSERLLSEYNWGNIYETLTEDVNTLTVEAGTFVCINSERYAIENNNEQTQYLGLDRFYYANGYGLIYDTSSFVNDETPSIIRRLDTYNIVD